MMVEIKRELMQLLGLIDVYTLVLNDKVLLQLLDEFI